VQPFQRPTTATGVDFEIARYLAKVLFNDTGERVQFVLITPGSRTAFLYSRWIDVIIATITITEDRKRVLDLSDPYFLSWSMILAPRENSINGIRLLSYVSSFPPAAPSVDVMPVILAVIMAIAVIAVLGKDKSYGY
jgi:ABC-type amino acid transport substrate-binding protein